jgi:hypothetical protein
MIEYTVKVHYNGAKYWYLNGKLHREDGPAVKYSDGEKYWYLNGEELNKKEFKNKIKIKKKKKIIFDEREELKSLRAHFNALPILINAITSSKDPDTRKAIEQWDEARMKLDVFKYNGTPT